ncbi:HNH endonuclease [Pseudactinotalea suaedae]|uniref:HNH endonuclease n=1 Tax=Pseudactinotalea suaedae TaxID=1524924 RepID=UPI0012E20F6A|nr:HNH endonuclease signature motif containing protein [Pseudactinotalea suaedae]
MVATLATGTGPQGVGAEIDVERVELIRALEDLKNAAAGLQVGVAEELDRSQRAQQVAAGVPAEKVGQGVASQLALARRVSPHRGRRHLSLARILRTELPATYAALRAGQITEYAATLMAQGTACVSVEDRAVIDHEIAGDPVQAQRLGERGIQVEAAKAAYRLDPASVVERRRRAESDRCVSLRPAPDSMTYLTALMPVADGVAVYAALTRAADTARATGAPRARGQVMADALRDAVLGAATAGTARDVGDRGEARGGVGDAGVAPEGAEHTGAPAGTEVVLNLIMSERQLFGIGAASEGEVLIGGPAGGLAHIDADLARQLAALTPADRVSVRRLYQHPGNGELVAMDSRRRRFPRGLQRLIRFRDQYCRNPWCRAPIRHTDHARRSSDHGLTSFGNGQGLCEACNYAKDALNWSTAARSDEAGHQVTITTPTGHTYLTSPPAPPGSWAPPQESFRTIVSTRRQPVLEIVRTAPPGAA